MWGFNLYAVARNDRQAYLYPNPNPKPKPNWQEMIAKLACTPKMKRAIWKEMKEGKTVKEISLGER